MSKIEELIEVVRDLPDEKVDGLLELARTWASSKRQAEKPMRVVRLGGIATGYDTPLSDIQQARKEMWSFDNEQP
jgi:hypothetical protein